MGYHNWLTPAIWRKQCNKVISISLRTRNKLFLCPWKEKNEEENFSFTAMIFHFELRLKIYKSSKFFVFRQTFFAYPLFLVKELHFYHKTLISNRGITVLRQYIGYSATRRMVNDRPFFFFLLLHYFWLFLTGKKREREIGKKLYKLINAEISR